MEIQEKVKKLSEIFRDWLPLPETELIHDNVYELIVAVILSAQCTDKRVNLITPAFYNRFPDLKSLAAAKFEDVFELIKSCSYPNNKSRHLIAMAKAVFEKFNGKIPSSLEELQQLPGIGRKTANVILSVAFNKSAMPVDTHVFRVAQRIGLAKPSKTPFEVEKQLTDIIPEKQLHDFHHWLIFHGRITCQARKPKCEVCQIKDYCDFFLNRQ